MLISYEDKVRIAQESLTQQSANQIAEATGIHRSVVQKALNDPEVVKIQEIFKGQVLNRYLRAFKSNEIEPKKVEPNEVEPSEAESNQVELSVSEEAELRIREVEALELIATSLASLRSVFEDAAKQKIPTQEKLDE